MANRRITLNGMHGVFEVPEGEKRIRFFSTLANCRELGSGPADLLKELKPMRERVKAADLDDLDSLLQRDLDDQRVANALVPYLLGIKDRLAFFPAVLGVLIPKGFIESSGNANYPMPKKSKDENNLSITKYGDNWTLTHYQINETETVLGALEINPEKTNIIVIDGQHRANAFRYVSKLFQNDESNDIYGSFYQNQQGNLPEKYLCDLPVTLIWFESEEEIEPRMISRRLFVDVNNSARTVSTSRTILLNDEDVVALITRFFYTSIAKNNFKPEVFSLLHSGFDIESDITSAKKNPFSITSPQIIYSAVEKFLLDTENYNDPSKYKVSRTTGKINSHNFKSLFGYDFEKKIYTRDSESNYTRQILVLKKNEYVKELQAKYKELLEEAFCHIFKEFNLFKTHFEATRTISEWVPNQTTWIIETWDKVFCGGEGLYYTFTSAIHSNPLTQTLRIKNYNGAIDDIKNQLKKVKIDIFKECELKDIESVYTTLNTKAFQVGLLSAFFLYNKEVNKKEEKNNIDDSEKGERIYYNAKLFIESLNKIEISSWVSILTKLKAEVIGNNLDPKQWPGFQKIIIRAIQESERFMMYNETNFTDSPDGKIFWKRIKNYCEKFINESEDSGENDISSKDSIPIEKIQEWAEEAKREMIELVTNCGLNPIISKDKDMSDEARKLIGDNEKKLFTQ